MFPVAVWGNVAEWVGGLGTTLAAFIALFVYWGSKRQDRRAQASLVQVDYNNGQGAQLKVANRSGQPITQVKFAPEVMSLSRASRRGEFDGMVIFGHCPPVHYPTYDFFRLSKSITKEMRQEPSKFVAFPQSREMKPGAEVDVLLSGLLSGGILYYLTFRDARGVDWSVNIVTKKLREVKVSRCRRLRSGVVGLVKGNWWIAKNQAIFLWRNHIYHPSGKESDRPDQTKAEACSGS